MGMSCQKLPILLGCGLLTASLGVISAGEPALPRDEGGEITFAVMTTDTLPGHSESLVLASADDGTYGRRGKIHVLSEGTSDDEARLAAISRLPLSKMTRQGRARVEAVLGNLSMFRAMPTIRFPVDHDAYRFFISHPDVAVSTWRALDVSQIQLWQTGPDSYETEIGNGSFGVLDVVLRGPNDQVVIGQGKFKSPLLLKPIEAVGVLHLQTRFITRADGTTETICHANLFVSFPSRTVETAAKVISPLTNMVIDRNFQECGLYAYVMTEAMRNRPGWTEQLAGDLDGILESSRREFLQVTATAYVKHRQRELVRQGKLPGK